MSSLIGPSPVKKKRGSGCGRRISIEGINGFLGVSKLDRRGRESFQELLAHRGIGVVMLEGLQIFEGVGVAPQGALGLRGPVQGVLAEKRVILSLEQPTEGLCRAAL